jgi:hypothetical protein
MFPLDGGVLSTNDLSKRQIVLLRVAAILAFIKGALFAFSLAFGLIAIIGLLVYDADTSALDEEVPSVQGVALLLTITIIPGATAILGGIYALRNKLRGAFWLLLTSLVFSATQLVLAQVLNPLGLDLFSVILLLLPLTSFIFALMAFLESPPSVPLTESSAQTPVEIGRSVAEGSIPAGWYADPDGKPSERYWDGEEWTEMSRPQTAATAVMAGIGKPTVTATGEPISPRSRAAAAVLCWFLGVIGVHRFYVGKIGTGVTQIFTLGGLGVWVLVDFIMILVGAFKDKENRLLWNW